MLTYGAIVEIPYNLLLNIGEVNVQKPRIEQKREWQAMSLLAWWAEHSKEKS